MRHHLRLLRIEPGGDFLHSRIHRCVRSRIRLGCEPAAKPLAGSVVSKRFAGAAVKRFANAVGLSPALSQILIRPAVPIRIGATIPSGILDDSRAEALHRGEIGDVMSARRRAVAHDPSSLHQNADRMLKRRLPHF